MNNKKFTDKESAKAFLKETEKPFKLKIVCAIVAVAVLVLMILVDSVWHMVFEEVDYLMLSVGTSYEPLVLNISLLKPKRILFL